MDKNKIAFINMPICFIVTILGELLEIFLIIIYSIMAKEALFFDDVLIYRQLVGFIICLCLLSFSVIMLLIILLVAPQIAYITIDYSGIKRGGCKRCSLTWENIKEARLISNSFPTLIFHVILSYDNLSPKINFGKAYKLRKNTIVIAMNRRRLKMILKHIKCPIVGLTDNIKKHIEKMTFI